MIEINKEQFLKLSEANRAKILKYIALRIIAYKDKKEKER